MRVTLDGTEYELSRPVLRTAVHFPNAIQAVIPDDAERNKEGLLSEDAIPPEYSTIAAAALGVCLPKEAGFPRHMGSLRPERLISYGDSIDRWAYANLDNMDEWITVCFDALRHVMDSIPDRNRQEKAADPTKAPTGAQLQD